MDCLTSFRAHPVPCALCVGVRASCVLTRYRVLLRPRVIRITVALCGVTTLSALGLALTWHLHDPFALFTSGVFTSVGLNSSDLNADAVLAKFAWWSRMGVACTTATSVLCGVLTAWMHARQTFQLAGTCMLLAGMVQLARIWSFNNPQYISTCTYVVVMPQYAVYSRSTYI